MCGFGRGVGLAERMGAVSKVGSRDSMISAPKEETKTKDGKKVKVKTKGTGKLSNPAVGTSTLNKSNAGLQIPTK
jgi:hypothetical protein